MITRSPWVVAVAAFALLSAACSGIQSSTVRTASAATPFTGVVVLRNSAPEGGQELGIVQVSGPRAIDELAPEFKRRVAELGADTGVVDKVSSSFDMETQSQSYSYKCGNSTCTGTRSVTVEVMTVQMIGRAFKAKATQ